MLIFMEEQKQFYVTRNDAVDLLSKYEARALSKQSDIQKYQTGWVRGIFAVAAVGAGILSLSYASSQDAVNLYVGAGLAILGMGAKVFGDRYFGVKSELYNQIAKHCENEKLELIQNTRAKKYHVGDFDAYKQQTINDLTDDRKKGLNTVLANKAFRGRDHQVGFGYIVATIASAGFALYISNKDTIDAYISATRNENDQTMTTDEARKGSKIRLER